MCLEFNFTYAARLEKYGGRGVFVRGVRFSEFYSAQGFKLIAI